MEESNIYDLVVRCEIDGEEKDFLFASYEISKKWYINN